MTDTDFIRIQSGQFTLGGEPIYFKGVNFQTPASPWAVFRVWDVPAIERCLDLARELGCNVIRAWMTVSDLVEYERYKQFIHMANARGMWIYVFFRWRSPYFRVGEIKAEEDFVYVANAAREFASWPGVFAYDVINEPDWISHQAWQWAMAPEDAAKRIHWLLRCVEILHENDPQRPVSVGMTFNRSWWEPGEAQSLLDAVDFLDFHYYRRTYRAHSLADAIRQAMARTQKPILVGEFGMSSDEAYSTPGEPAHSEIIQADTYREMCAEIQEERIAGAIQWSLTAHIDHPRAEGENEYGIIRADYTLKPAAEVFRDHLKASRWIV